MPLKCCQSVTQKLLSKPPTELLCVAIDIPMVLEPSGSRIKGVSLRGTITGHQSLFVDDEVEGSIELSEGALTIGPDAMVHADIKAPNIIILGEIKGNVHASDRVEIRHSAKVNGDIVAQRISIEDGAFFKGGIDIRKQTTSSRSGQEHLSQATRCSIP